MVKSFTKEDLMYKAWEIMDDKAYNLIQLELFKEFKDKFSCPFCGEKHIEDVNEIEIGDEFEYIAFRELRCEECNHLFTIEFPIDKD